MCRVGLRDARISIDGAEFGMVESGQWCCLWVEMNHKCALQGDVDKIKLVQ